MSSWARNCGKLACSETSRKAGPLTGNCKRRASSATRICPWKAEAGRRSKSSSSAMSMSRTSGRAFNAASTKRSASQRLTKEQAAALADLERRRQQSEIEAVGRLAGGVAHAFNNLMTTVLGHSEIMLAGMNPGDTYFASAQAIKRSASRTAALTQKLLAFGR